MTFEELNEEFQRYWNQLLNEPVLEVQTNLVKICNHLLEIMIKAFKEENEL